MVTITRPFFLACPSPPGVARVVALLRSPRWGSPAWTSFPNSGAMPQKTKKEEKGEGKKEYNPHPSRRVHDEEGKEILTSTPDDVAIYYPCFVSHLSRNVFCFCTDFMSCPQVSHWGLLLLLLFLVVVVFVSKIYMRGIMNGGTIQVQGHLFVWIHPSCS